MVMAVLPKEDFTTLSFTFMQRVHFDLYKIHLHKGSKARVFRIALLEFVFSFWVSEPIVHGTLLTSSQVNFEINNEFTKK